MRLVLFDIDGTLLLTGGVGQSSARVSLERVFGTAGRVDEFYPGGRTIEAIFKDTLADAGIPDKVFQTKRQALYADFFEEFKRRLESGQHSIRPLPGTLALLEVLQARGDVVVGLVTGNHQYTARHKLAFAGFDLGLFQVGAYGDESNHRPDLVRLAQSRAAELTGEPLDGRHTVMIGDTTRDVLSAREAGAVSVAVATGTDDLDLLQTVSPDHLLPDLADLEQVLAIIMEAEQV
jgi:phosphoglycolate phosphatase